MTAKLSDAEREKSARIVAMFSVLVHAWQTNDFHEAARARDELERLGIKQMLGHQGAAHDGEEDELRAIRLELLSSIYDALDTDVKSRNAMDIKGLCEAYSHLAQLLPRISQ